VLRLVTLGSPVTLGPGVYWWATGSTDGAGTLMGYTSIQQFTAQIANASVVRFGSAANSLSAGAMPASLGTVTGFGTASTFNLPFVMFIV
jgi:hypothetical protein